MINHGQQQKMESKSLNKLLNNNFAQNNENNTNNFIYAVITEINKGYTYKDFENNKTAFDKSKNNSNIIFNN